MYPPPLYDSMPKQLLEIGTSYQKIDAASSPLFTNQCRNSGLITWDETL